MGLFTTLEAAEYLRVKQRKLYELAPEGVIARTKITAKWLFPRSELDRRVVSSLVRAKGLEQTGPLPIVDRRHGPPLERAERETGSGLTRFGRSESVACGVHLRNLYGQAVPMSKPCGAEAGFPRLLWWASRDWSKMCRGRAGQSDGHHVVRPRPRATGPYGGTTGRSGSAIVTAGASPPDRRGRRGTRHCEPAMSDRIRYCHRGLVG